MSCSHNAGPNTIGVAFAFANAVESVCSGTGANAAAGNDGL